MSETRSLPRFWVIIPAAGVGSRMQADKPKQYLTVEGKTILEHTVGCFLKHPRFQFICIAIAETDESWQQLPLAKNPQVFACPGGAERVDSVLNGLEYLEHEAKPDDWVWVHDAARPCLSTLEIDALITSLDRSCVGSVLAVPVNDTVKRAAAEGLSVQTVDRASLWRAMTPQVFRFAALREVLLTCRHEGVHVTDESSAFEYCGKYPNLVAGSENNIKVTRPGDLARVEQTLGGVMGRTIPRIGTGFDVHAFEQGKSITLGGVVIPYSQGLKAHSDGDVLLHAIMDALLGALALGDIGKHFPDTDPEWRGVDSRQLLRAVLKLVQNQGYDVVNIDSTIVAEAPKMAPFIKTMRENIAADLQLDINEVSVKATTTERLGFTGRKEGIACQASALVIRQVSNAT